MNAFPQNLRSPRPGGIYSLAASLKLENVLSKKWKFSFYTVEQNTEAFDAF